MTELWTTVLYLRVNIVNISGENCLCTPIVFSKEVFPRQNSDDVGTALVDRALKKIRYVILCSICFIVFVVVVERFI